MPKKAALFSLIKSLDKSEKRHFVLSQKHYGGDKNHMLLFDYLDKHDSVSDLAIRETFANHTFAKQPHVTKNYLRKQILKSLRLFHAKDSINVQLYELLSEIEIVFKKELYSICQDLILKAERLSERYEKFAELLLVLGWKRRLLVARVGSQQAVAQTQEVIAKEAEVIRLMANYNEFVALTYSFFGQLLTPAHIESLKSNSLIQNKSNALSFSSLILYYHLQYVLYTFGGNPSEGLAQLTELINQFEKRPHLIQQNPDGYVTALNNKMGALLHLHKPEEALKLLYVIRHVPDKYKLKQSNYIVKVFLKTYNVELELYRDLKAWERGRSLIDEIRAFLIFNTRIVSQSYLISFHYQFAYIHFKLGEYSQSLHALNTIVNSTSSEERKDIQVYARLLLLIIHYELGNITVLKYVVEATRRFVKKSRSPYLFEKRILKLFSKLSITAKLEHKAILSNYKADLFDGISDKEKAHVLDYLDFTDWLNQKTTKC